MSSPVVPSFISAVIGRYLNDKSAIQARFRFSCRLVAWRTPVGCYRYYLRGTGVYGGIFYSGTLADGVRRGSGWPLRLFSCCQPISTLYGSRPTAAGPELCRLAADCLPFAAFVTIRARKGVPLFISVMQPVLLWIGALHSSFGIDKFRLVPADA